MYDSVWSLSPTRISLGPRTDAPAILFNSVQIVSASQDKEQEEIRWSHGCQHKQAPRQRSLLTEYKADGVLNEIFDECSDRMKELERGRQELVAQSQDGVEYGEHGIQDRVEDAGHRLGKVVERRSDRHCGGYVSKRGARSVSIAHHPDIPLVSSLAIQE